VDGNGNVYVADSSNNIIRKITSAGVVSTLAGATSGGIADGTGSAARFFNPRGIAVDAGGNVYVADTGSHTIRKIDVNGTVGTIAGHASSVGAADGPGSSARFSSPTGISVDGQGNLYVADLGNGTIRKITPNGSVTTLAGNPGPQLAQQMGPEMQPNSTAPIR